MTFGTPYPAQPVYSMPHTHVLHTPRLRTDIPIRGTRAHQVIPLFSRNATLYSNSCPVAPPLSRVQRHVYAFFSNPVARTAV